ncbi:uncharacterized protein LOC128555350 [Mercenaria mercenaria]|uniref:uncharacterized protein LOC128555350 n=1 Tax=Mercenaria mercenaria TaxID=6596 RepID=UPI00234E7954|nr:uncharacterized protein LOC128555350 [Mercenaria mercenaria]
MATSVAPTSATSLCLDENAIKGIALALKDTIQTDVCTMLNSTIETIVKGVVDGLQSQINSLKTESESLKKSNTALQDRVDYLEFQVDSSERYSRRDSLRISGIVESKDENTDTHIMKMASAVGSPLSLEDISVSHKVGKPKVSEKPRDILVKFVSRRPRDLFYRNRVLLKSKGYKGQFVNEDLTKYRASLLYEARQLVKNKNIVGAWSTNGNIVIKASKNRKTTVHKINCRGDLDPFYSYTCDD